MQASEKRDFQVANNNKFIQSMSFLRKDTNSQAISWWAMDLLISNGFGLKKYENPTLLPTLKRDQLYFHTLLRWNTKNGAHGESSSTKLFY